MKYLPQIKLTDVYDISYIIVYFHRTNLSIRLQQFPYVFIAVVHAQTSWKLLQFVQHRLQLLPMNKICKLDDFYLHISDADC